MKKGASRFNQRRIYNLIARNLLQHLMSYDLVALRPLEAVAGTEQMEVLLCDDLARMQRAAGSDGAFQLHLCRSHGSVDVQLFFPQPTFSYPDVAYHAVHPVRSQRALLVSSLHAAVDGDMLLYHFGTHSYGNNRGGDADGVVGETDSVLAIMLFQVADSLQIEIIGMGRVLGYAVQDGNIIMIAGDHFQGIIQFLPTRHAGGQDDGYPCLRHHFQQGEVSEVAACHFQAVGREKFQQREAAFEQSVSTKSSPKDLACL